MFRTQKYNTKNKAEKSFAQNNSITLQGVGIICINTNKGTL